jgi:hypothetical protein
MQLHVLFFVWYRLQVRISMLRRVRASDHSGLFSMWV